MPSIPLKLLMGIVVALVAIVPAVIAFVPIYQVGVDSVSDTVQLVRQTAVARATERTISTFTYPQRALYALETASKSGVLNLSLTNLTAADITRLNLYIAETLFGDTLEMATSFSILIQEARYFAFATPNPVNLLIQYNDAAGQYDGYAAYADATGKQDLAYVYRSSETNVWNNLLNFPSVRALDAQKGTTARWVPDLIDGIASPQLVAGFPFTGAAGLTGFVWFDVSTAFISPFLQTLGLSGSYRAMIIHRGSRVVIGNSWDEEAFKVISANNLLRRTPSDFNDTLVRRVVTHFGSDEQIVNAALPYSSTTGSGQDLMFIDATHVNDSLGLDVMLVVAIPESEYLGNVYTTRWVVVGAVIGSIVVIVILGIVFAVLIVRPIDEVSRQMDRTARLETDVDDCGSDSMLSEVRAMQGSYRKMRDQLAIMMKYLPPSVLATLLQDSLSSDGDDDEEGSTVLSISHLMHSSIQSSNIGMELSNLTRQSRRASIDPTHLAVCESVTSAGRDTSRRHSSVSTAGCTSRGTKTSPSTKAPNMSLSLTNRRIAVMAMNVSGWHGMLKGHCRGSSQRYDRVLSGYLEAVSRRVKEGRGVLDMFQGDRVFASFNAVSQVAAFTRRAITTAYDVRNDLLRGGGDMPSLQVTGGVSVGSATVGNAGTADMLKFTITGQVYSEAAALERYGRTTLKRGARGGTSDFTPTDVRTLAPDVGFTANPIMIPGTVAQDVESNFILQTVDVFETNGKGNSSNSQIEGNPLTLPIGTIITQRRTTIACVERLFKTGDTEEWMYELEQLRGTNPFASTNAAFLAIARGDTIANIMSIGGLTAGDLDAVRTFLGPRPRRTVDGTTTVNHTPATTNGLPPIPFLVVDGSPENSMGEDSISSVGSSPQYGSGPNLLRSLSSHRVGSVHRVSSVRSVSSPRDKYHRSSSTFRAGHVRLVEILKCMDSDGDVSMYAKKIF